MNRERAKEIRSFATRETRFGIIKYDDLTELCDFYLANAPKPKIKPEDQPGVPVKIEEAELTVGYGQYVFIDRNTGTYATYRLTAATHVVYIEVPR